MAAHDEQHPPQEELKSIARPVEMPDGSGGPEAHSREEGAAMRRFPDRPLAICVEQIVAEHNHVVIDRHQADGDVGEVAHVVVCRGVNGRHCGVVVRAAPIFATAEFELAVLVRLEDGEREGDEGVAR